MNKDNVVFLSDKSPREVKKDKVEVKFFRNTVLNDEISRAHYHSSTEFNIVLRGELGCVVDDENFYAKKGQIFCFSTMESHMFIGKKDSEILCVIISAETLKNFSRSQKEKLPLFLDNIELNEEIIKKFLQWEEISSICNDLENVGFVNLILGNIVRNYGVRKEHRSHEAITYRNSEALLIRSILDYINDNCEKNITLDTLANEFGYSRTSISRTLHKVIHQDLRSYLNMVRVERVNDKLFKNPEMNITNIAFECGFENMNSFYRAYRKRFGCTPRNRK